MYGLDAWHNSLTPVSAVRISVSFILGRSHILFFCYLWFTALISFSLSLFSFLMNNRFSLSLSLVSAGVAAFHFASSYSLSSTWQPCGKSGFMTWEMRQDWAHAWPTLPPLPVNIKSSPSLKAFAAPAAPLLSPSPRSPVANNSSYSSNHNRCKATLKVFSVVNVVKAQMGGL